MTDRRRSVLLLATLTVLAMVRAAPTLPPMRGGFSGELQVNLPGVPAIPWRVEVAPDADGGPRFVVAAEPPEAQLRATVVLDPTGEIGSWRIDEARASAAAWWPRLAPPVAPELAGIALSGDLVVSGHGTWRGGEPQGPLTLAWQLPTASASEPELALSGADLRFTLASGWARGVLQGDGELRIQQTLVSGIQLVELFLAYSLHPDGVIRVTELSGQAFGGAIEVAPFSWRAGLSELILAVEFQNVDLEVLSSRLPEIVRDARGEVSGRARFRWREGPGIEPLGGELTGSVGSDVRLRLAPQPGLLTGNLPRRFQFLPNWLGPVARTWLAPANPVYPTLEGIELGREPLLVEQFSLEFFPPDDPLGRTARIWVDGRPQADPQVERVTLTINLSGPLTDLLKLGTDDRVKISTGVGPVPPPAPFAD